MSCNRNSKFNNFDEQQIHAIAIGIKVYEINASTAIIKTTVRAVAIKNGSLHLPKCSLEIVAAPRFY